MNKWKIEKLVVADGTTKAGREIESGVLYANSNKLGGYEQLYPIEKQTLSLTPYSIRAFTRKLGLLPPTSEVSQEAIEEIGSEVETMDALIIWMEAHAGTPVDVGGCGARSDIRNEGWYYSPLGADNPIFLNDDSFVAALCNAVFVFDGVAAAKRAFLQLSSAPELSGILKVLLPLVHRVPGHFNIKKVSKGEQARYDRNRFRWVARQERGVWLVRVRNEGLMDHCVCVDAGSSLVRDSASRRPFSLTTNVLCLIGGSDAKNLHVIEVRELYREKQLEK